MTHVPCWPIACLRYGALLETHIEAVAYACKFQDH